MYGHPQQHRSWPCPRSVLYFLVSFCLALQIITHKAISTPVAGHAAPSAYPASHGATSGVAASTQFIQSTYTHTAVDPQDTQALPASPGSQVEFYSRAPGTQYSAVQSNIVVQGLSVLSPVTSLSITCYQNNSPGVVQNPPSHSTMATMQCRRPILHHRAGAFGLAPGPRRVSLPPRSSTKVHMRTALSTRTALRPIALIPPAGLSPSIGHLVRDTVQVGRPLCPWRLRPRTTMKPTATTVPRIL